MPDLSTFAHLAPYHILSYGTLLGSEIFQSFIGGIVAFRTLPRASFASLQSGLFPVYFTMQTALPVIMALTYPGTSTLTGRIDGGVAGVMAEQNRWAVLAPLGMIFVGGLSNLLVVGPATTKTMKERKHQETRDGKKYFDAGPHSPAMQQLNKRFGMLHGASSLINMVALGATMWYGGTLAEMLR